MFARLALLGGFATVLAAVGSDATHLSTTVSLAITVGAGSVTTITVALISASGRRRDQRELEAEVIDLRRDLRDTKDLLAARDEEIRRLRHLRARGDR